MGAVIETVCPSCGASVTSRHVIRGATRSTQEVRLSVQCHSCGAAYFVDSTVRGVMDMDDDRWRQHP
jgi:uncharacterized Zn finger protein